MEKTPPGGKNNQKKKDIKQRPDIYNPLTGNIRFFANLEDGQIPTGERTVDEPVHRGTGKIFRPRDDKRGD